MALTVMHLLAVLLLFCPWSCSADTIQLLVYPEEGCGLNSNATQQISVITNDIGCFHLGPGDLALLVRQGTAQRFGELQMRVYSDVGSTPECETIKDFVWVKENQCSNHSISVGSTVKSWKLFANDATGARFPLVASVITLLYLLM